MKRELEILAVWVIIVGALIIAENTLPSRHTDDLGLAVLGLEVLLGIISIAIGIKSGGREAYLFYGFGALFLWALPMYARIFLSGDVGTEFLYHVYVGKIANAFLLLFPLLFALTSYVLRRMRPVGVALVSATLALLVVAGLSSDYILDPYNLHKAKEYAFYTDLTSLDAEIRAGTGSVPSDQALSEEMAARLSRGDTPVDRDEIAEAVRRLSPALRDTDGTTIFWAPANRLVMTSAAVSLGLIAILLFLNYYKNRPHSAYIDKIVLLLGPFYAVEVFHMYAFTVTASTETYLELFRLSQFFVIAILLVLVYVFELRLRFSASAVGGFYAKLLESDPLKVTRFKDEFDKIILTSFFSPEKSLTRLAKLTEKDKGGP